ncbi:diversity-generating retroelement protein Avd [candidate division KSB1 bacterium]|nr:diversity-generating retroelement protein Avd [candidate division KSB1 bacterium]
MIIQKKAYDYCKWLLNHTAKFPKSFRFSVAVRIENAILDFVESVNIANMRKDKIPPLKRADEALSRLRLLLRLSYEMQFINLQSYEYSSSQIAELGRLLGGWLKNPAHTGGKEP